MSMDRAEIESHVREVLEEALGVEADEVQMDATLIGDLGAESIDFLDINFQLEQKFSTDDAPFKIEQGELFPENFADDPEIVEDGRLTDKGMALLKERMPHVDFSAFESDRSMNKLAELFTVKSLVDFVERKLASSAAASS